MKMQEVILRLRELAPEAAQNVDLALKDFYVMEDLLSDLQACVSSSTREAVLKLIDGRRRELAKCLACAQDATGKLQKLNESYKEKIGPRTKPPKDIEGQPMLPGFEDEGGTPTTMGGTPVDMGGTPTEMGGTPAITVGRGGTMSFRRSGRHG